MTQLILDIDKIGGFDHLIQLLDWADQVLIKKLSNNDRDWAQLENKHQAGIYMPPAQRDSGFFPSLTVKNRTDGKIEEIREVYFPIEWPQIGEIKKARLVNYTSKGVETHITGIPKAAFSELAPASFIIIGRKDGYEAYRCLTIDSTSDDATRLIDIFELQLDFLIGIFNPSSYRKKALEELLDFAEQVVAAWQTGKIGQFAKEQAKMPSTLELAEEAKTRFLRENGLPNLDPWKLENPGDILREISRGVEWELFREYQKRERAVMLVRMIMSDVPGPITAKSSIMSLVNLLPEIDGLMLSASQQRKSRAGYSFEHHIESMLMDGQIPHEKQVVIEAKKRPDFILPSLAGLRAPKQGNSSGLILSAKTTLRERWKQVEREMKGGGELFLATVDENIASNAIKEMGEMGINLVVPEALMNSKETEYAGHKNVLSFAIFFHDVVNKRNWK